MQATASRLQLDGRRAAQLAMVLLFVAMVIEGMSVEVFGLTLRAPYLAAPFAWLVILFNSIRERRPVRIPLAALFLLAWLAVLAISSAASPLPLAGTAVHLLRFSLLVAAFLALPNLIRDEEMAAWALRAFLFVVVAEIALGLILLALHMLLGVEVPGVRVGYEECPAVAAVGSLIESNYYGQLAMVSTVMLTGLVAVPGIRIGISRWMSVAFLVVSVLGLIFSLARMPWIATVFAVFLLLLLIGWSSNTLHRHLVLAISIGLTTFAAFVVSLLIVTPTFGPVCRGWLSVRGAISAANLDQLIPLIEEIPNYQRTLALVEVEAESPLYHVESGGSSTAGRIDQLSTLGEAWIQRPVIGWGLLGLDRLSIAGRYERDPWITNLAFALLVDSGIIGFLLFTGFIVTLLWESWHSYRSTSAPCSYLNGLLFTSVFALLIAYQATHALWIAMPYVIFGLTTSIASVSSRQTVGA